ncbi:chorismate synthase [Virgibacillus halodenitrificans]|uniref:Chorismate synthase n=1 Tax=Virgibacillus halodenitrificans TaxID=1482 RepID=A0ABR7VL11_VIRHA|nr:chorismate synthase [Virgibacillus halodenitrificans]MBD1222610.1 chorismate synthase [Virgibacillus halodenitrificans]MCG1028305.1 chorismate synthase [Virgibacillus halodenitrificans]MYL47518.1 chorismate synthase [Virgibacillus halodenitrificans]MYL56891.1 chorismate synthase [Virgibacillus halodenitrificans]CDQ35641.1 Chorismate synthase [Virgibacillus halodenitrificans]
MRYLTAGESHGKKLTTIIEGVPARMPLVKENINESLLRRQKGHGRGKRMQIEKDLVEITSGIRHGYTLGSPITLVINNDDFKHWVDIMGEDPIEADAKIRRVITRPRPGHADLNGAMKYGHRDIRNVLERSSARETAARVAAGAVAKTLLKQLDIEISGYVKEIAGIEAKEVEELSIKDRQTISEDSPVRVLDKDVEQEMMDAIDQAKQEGDSIGGVVEVYVEGMPAGVGSYVHFDRKLDSRIAGSVVSINAFKGVEFGLGFEAAKRNGSKVHDEIAWDEEIGYYRKTNRLGGFEGGMTTGMPIVVKGVMKPIPTLMKRPLQSVDIETKEPFKATVERSDACAVPAAAVVMEHVVAFELAKAITEQFPSDQFPTLKKAIDDYREEIRCF